MHTQAEMEARKRQYRNDLQEIARIRCGVSEPPPPTATPTHDKFIEGFSYRDAIAKALNLSGGKK